MRLRLVLGATCLMLAAASLTGCVTINVPAPAPTPKNVSSAPSSVEPAEDVSGALQALGGAIGALAKSSGPAPSADDCSYTAIVVGQLANATPAERWRGTYESITNNMRVIAGLCSADPSSPDAINLAKLTRPNVAQILNDEKYLGQTSWGS
jgi:hypothetical protein